MSKSFTMTVVAPNRNTPFVFLKVFENLDAAIVWSCGEIAMQDAKYVLIREGELASDPVVWDSRKQPKTAIWTHTPVPPSFPLNIVNARFEERANSLLGDHDSGVDFSTWQPHEKEGFRDFRYKQPGVRMAWMVYLDLALAHFKKNGSIV